MVNSWKSSSMALLLGVGVGVAGVLLLRPAKEPCPMLDNSDPFDPIEEASLESFPASDSPAY